MRVYFLPNEYYSSITPSLLHYFDWFYQYSLRSLLRRYFVFFNSSHRTSAVVSLLLCGGGGSWVQLMTSLYSGTVPNDSVILWVHHAFFVVRAWWGVGQIQPGFIHVLPLLKQQIWVGNKRTQASLNEEYVQNILLKRGTATQLMSWLSFLWLVPLMLTPKSVSSTAGYLEKRYVCWQEVLRHFHGIRHFARDKRLRLDTPGWRVLGFDGKLLMKMWWKGSATEFWGLPHVFWDRE